MFQRKFLPFWAAVVTCAAAMPAQAQSGPVLLRDSFSIGREHGILCQVQDRSIGNPAGRSVFDRRWAVVCRDSALPVATIYAFKDAPGAADAAVAPWRRESVDCSAAQHGIETDVVGSSLTSCKIAGAGLEWSIIEVEDSGLHFVADGFAAYDSATLLALRSLLENRVVQGTIDVATTMASDPFAFARVQAETLEPEQALAEGYRRNLGGDYAEAAAYFETLQDRLEQSGEASTISVGEFTVNRALQRSNMGEFGTADRLFADARPQTAGDPIGERLQRNFEAIHLLNQRRPDEAAARAGEPLSAAALQVDLDARKLEISLPLSERLNGSGDGLFGFIDEVRLSQRERAEILDAQALQLRGSALRLQGDLAGARSALLDSYARAIAVRDGRVTSITRMRAQTLSELATIAEAQGDPASAEGYLGNALALLEVQYPERRTVSAARARLADFYLRQNRRAEGLALFAQVIERAIGQSDAATGFANRLAPYFAELAPEVASDPQAAEAFFKAIQVLVRPGVAETQAILSRELSARTDDASRLFRQSTDLSRDIERSRIRLQSLVAADVAANDPRRAELAGRIEELQEAQLRTQAELADYPEYRVVAPRSLTLEEFRASLQPGEAYARIALVGRDLYMFWTDRARATAWKLDLSEEDLDFQVDMLRASISIDEGGRILTYPYDIGVARALYKDLFAPVADRLAATDHLIFEPDAALLRLPVDILVADDASVERYHARVAAGGDPYDFTGTAWLARATRVSTAVSAQAFVDARSTARSRAARAYLGLGENTPLGGNTAPHARAVMASGSSRCGWSLATWNNPIDDAELVAVRGLLGAGESELVTGKAFTDDGLAARTDLDQYRVLHFATHGLVTPPDPSCPAKPALLTSFGGETSDGLLSFEEIFDLDLDADIVILSACDTAGAASIEATRAAGVGSGGGTALDGLVRSFVGAGSRAVLASHWPVPDDYDATTRLVSEMFRLGRTVDIGHALRGSQALLMDRLDTSHPYYWAGFAIVGDAARPLLTDRASALARAEDPRLGH
ncbi:MAG: CHAT domain-containing protein [Erythrobacter sp.]